MPQIPELRLFVFKTLVAPSLGEGFEFRDFVPQPAHDLGFSAARQ
jgi:hypothetical protein